jgi:peptidoglycan/xylan/chitin deacetylase (PgdA/CDA1 family)
MGPEETAQELDDARSQIRDASGVDIDEVAVPFGAYNRRVLRQLAKRGYQAVYTSDGGVCSGGWLRPRTSIRRDMVENDIERIVSGAEKPARRLRRRLAMTKKRYL